MFGMCVCREREREIYEIAMIKKKVCNELNCSYMHVHVCLLL